MTSRRTVLTSCAATLLIAAAHPAFAQSKPNPVPLRVVTPPLTNYTPLLVAREKGFFADENLSVTWSSVTQSSVSIEAVYGGSAEIGAGGVLEPMIARSNGLDIVLAAPSARIQKTPPDNSALMVRASSDIQKPSDLVGKKVSVGLLNSINHVHMNEWLRKNGVDPKSLQFLEIPFSQMPDALMQNRLDVVWAVEPFLTIMKKSGGARVFAHPYIDNLPGMDITAYYAKESWLKANTDTMRRFRRAVIRAANYLKSAPKEERDSWVSKFSGVKPELVAEMALPDFATEINLASLRANMELVVNQKLAKPFDVATMVWNP